MSRRIGFIARSFVPFAVIVRFAVALSTLAVSTPRAQSAGTVTLDVPQLALAGTAKGFEFVSFQFRVYLVAIGDPVSDYSANVLANDYENYTYLHPGGGGSGRGGGYRPPTYVRGPGASYSDTYTNVISPPHELDALFHFSGADVAGVPLALSVSDSGDYSLLLTADADPSHSPIDPSAALSNQLYTLEYRTDSLLGSQVTLLMAPPLPGDYNHDGMVDSADYSVWRDSLGSTTKLAADGNGNGIIDAGDYDLWLSQFGRAVAGSGATATVPEPASWLALLLAAAVAAVACVRARCATNAV
jgi:hypothetical protein